MAYTANKMRCSALRKMFYDDPADSTVARYVSPDGVSTFYDMSGYGTFLSMAHLLVLGGGTGVVTYKIFGNNAATGGSPLEIVAHATPTTADAATDMLVLEIDAAQLRALGADYKYVAVQIDSNNAGDIFEHYFEFGQPRFAHDALTADYISA